MSKNVESSAARLETVNNWLMGMRRHTRYVGYNMCQAWPSFFYDKVFTKAYLPFTIRHNFIAAGALYLGYRTYIRRKAARAKS